MARLIATILIVLGAMAFGVGFLIVTPEELEKDSCRTLGERVVGVLCMVFCGGIGTGGVVLAGTGLQDELLFETMLGMMVAAAGYGFAWLRYWVLTTRG